MVSRRKYRASQRKNKHLHGRMAPSSGRMCTDWHQRRDGRRRRSGWAGAQGRKGHRAHSCAPDRGAAKMSGVQY